jgi:hypothetical protein
VSGVPQGPSLNAVVGKIAAPRKKKPERRA